MACAEPLPFEFLVLSAGVAAAYCCWAALGLTQKHEPWTDALVGEVFYVTALGCFLALLRHATDPAWLYGTGAAVFVGYAMQVAARVVK